MPRKDAKGNLKTANHIGILVKTIIQVILEMDIYILSNYKLAPQAKIL